MMNREELRAFRQNILPVVSAADLAQEAGWTTTWVYDIENGNWNKTGYAGNRDTYTTTTEQKYINAVKNVREKKKAGVWRSQHKEELKQRKEEREMRKKAEEKAKDKWREEKYLSDMKAFRAELKARREAWKKYYAEHNN